MTLMAVVVVAAPPGGAAGGGAAKAAPKKGLLTGLTSLSVQMIMLQKKIEDTLLSKVDNPKEAAELISEYVYVAGLMMQPQ